MADACGAWVDDSDVVETALGNCPNLAYHGQRQLLLAKSLDSSPHFFGEGFRNSFQTILESGGGVTWHFLRSVNF
jgi:hypothetical protein